MNRFGSFCLDISSFGIISAILIWNFHDDVKNAIYFFLISIFLFLLCWSLLKLAIKAIENKTTDFDSVEEADEKCFWMFPCIIIPLIQKELDLSQTIYIVVVIIFMVVYWKSISFIYNPIVLIFGYHYYNVSIQGKSFTLISKQKILEPYKKITVGKLSDNLIIAKTGG